MLSERAAERSSKLVLLELCAFGREVVARVKIGITQKLETVSVKLTATRLGENENLPTAVIAVFGIETVGQNAQLLDRIEIRNNGGSHVDVLLHVTAVDAKPIRRFALAADGGASRIEVAGRGGAGNAAHDDGIGLLRTGGNDARLKGHQIGKAPTVQWDAGYLGGRDGFSHLGGGSVDLDTFSTNLDGGRFGRQLKFNVHS